jgi:uncharacterized protein (TIGR03790 family)
VKLVAFLIAFLLALFPAWVFPNDTVLLVVNENSPDSMAIGYYYAAKRDVPHICRLRTDATERITREAFNTDILQPVARYLRTHSLQDRILYIVTTGGVPLIVEDNLASVDSELTLTYHYMLTGHFPYAVRIENPYFAVGDNFRPFLRRNFDIYLVTRLTARDLVDSALVSESGGDFYFDMASPQQSMESDWVREAVGDLKKSGFKATLDDTGSVLDNLTDVQGYISQGAVEAPSIQWRAGAIAAVLDKDFGPSVSDYITSGVTGFGYYVADPLPDGYFRPQILFKTYTSGYNLAEAFYASSRYLSWRQVVIGDPLAAPYSKSSPESISISINPDTGLPEYFSKRRMDYLMQKHSTSREAVLLLLRAEVAETRGDRDKALALADQSLQQDPYLEEVNQLKARLAVMTEEHPSEFSTMVTEDPPSESPPEVVEFSEAKTRPQSSKSQEDYPVRVISKTPIEYPFDAKVAKVEGVVVVNLLIDEMGQVMKSEVVRGDRRLAEAVQEGVKGWRFEPKLVNGRPVISTFPLSVSFRLENN